MKVFCNNFWEGFAEGTDGIHFGFFRDLFKRVFGTEITIGSLHDSDILLETHIVHQTFVHAKEWKCTIFFCGEGSRHVPNNGYTFVLGSQGDVACPLGLVYEFCKPWTYENRSNVPKKEICAIISSDAGNHHVRTRQVILEKLLANGFEIDFGGRYKNNIGYQVKGNYFCQELIDFYKQYKIVIAFENHCNDFYMTEKVINALRAGSVPLYYGAKKSCHYIPKDRMIPVDEENLCIDEIKRVLTDDEYFLKKVNCPNFVRPLNVVMAEMANKCKAILSTGWIPNFICNTEYERVDLGLCKFFNIEPSYIVWSKNTRFHPYFNKFKESFSQNQKSLAINHIGIFETFDMSRYLVMFESDAKPLHDMAVIADRITNIVGLMEKNDVDFVFLGKGCFDGIDLSFKFKHEDENCRFDIDLSKNQIKGGLCLTGASRCTEAYIVSPMGRKKYLDFFHERNDNYPIDWSFNHFFFQKRVKSCWLMPELFCQSVHPSMVTNYDQEL